MTPAEYPVQDYLYSQRDPRWASMKLGFSGLTMHDFGCVVTCVSYLLSRLYGKYVFPSDLLTWLNANGGFTPDGRLYWDAVRRFPPFGLVYSTSIFNRTYTLRNVLFGRYSHWVVELRGGLCMDPWDGTIKNINQPYFTDTGIRRYFKALTTPKT